MVYTNLYIVFERIKKEKIPLEYVDWEIYQSSTESRELNEHIKKSIDFVVQNVPESDTEYIALMEDGSYHITDSYSKGSCLELLHYRGYKYLFLVCNQYEILINYEPEGKEFCHWVDYPRWEYIPDKDDFYESYLGGDYYILNTYDAFCKYAKYNGNTVLSKELSKPFFDKTVDCLQKANLNFETKICNSNQVVLIRENGNKTTTFTIVMFDHLIIIVDYINWGIATPVT